MQEPRSLSRKLALLMFVRNVSVVSIAMVHANLYVCVCVCVCIVCMYREGKKLGSFDRSIDE